MKLSQVTIKNYRGFFGENVLNFNTNKKNKNINLIIARNDTGKTTFLNAIYWCLYGEEQFYSSKNSNKRIMSNMNIAETQIDKNLNFSVSLVFDDEKGPKYEITRKRIFKRVYGDKNDLKIIQQGEDDFYGNERNSNGSGFEPIEYICDFVASKIPKGISSFFLLDGEQLKAIFTSDINYKIKDAIERVANINSINGMISHLQNLNKKYSRMKSGINANFSEIQKGIDKCDERINKKDDRLNFLLKENETLRGRISDLAEFLQNNNAAILRQYGAREKQIKEENVQISESIKSNEGELNALVIQSYILKNAEPALNFTLKKFDNIIASDNFPPAVDSAHVLQLIKRKICICGTKICKDSDEEKMLKKLANVKSYKEYVRVISEGAARFPEMIESLPIKIKLIGENKIKILKSEKRLQENVKELKEINQKLKNSDVDKIKEKAEDREIAERSIFKNEKEIGNLENDIGDLKDIKKEAERELTKIKIKNLSDQLIIKKCKKCKQLIDYANEIKKSIMKKIKDNIQESTANNFIDLHWKAEDYDKVSILDDFSLSVKDRHRGELINELSQGAALCFGLAFMTALRNYSGYDVPVIIDSPVGKVDEGNRENIAKKLPEHLKGKQVIFLVTSSEYTSVFKEFLEEKIATKITIKYNKITGGIDISHDSN